MCCINNPSQLRTSLPHELLDEIFSYLPSVDRRSFQNFSLVAKSWISPSQRRLFEIVFIRTTTYRLWQNSIPPADDGPLQHVRSLTYAADIVTPIWPDLRDYYPFLHHLRHLTLRSSCVPPTTYWPVETFSAFEDTLSQLTLDSCAVTISSLVTLINHFPNLDRLDLSRLSREVDGEPAPPLSRQLLGQLRIPEVSGDEFGLLDQLSELGLAFDEIVVNEVHKRPLGI